MKEFPTVITIFSAPNYCDYYQNKGAILKFNVLTFLHRTTISKSNRSSKSNTHMSSLISKISSPGASHLSVKMFLRYGITCINLKLLLIKKMQFPCFWLESRKFWVKCLIILKYWLSLSCIRFKIKLQFPAKNFYRLLNLVKFNYSKKLRGRLRLKE